MDIDAERVRISKEIRELERILDPSSSSINVDVSESSLDSDSDAGQCPRSLVRAAVSALGFRSAAVCCGAGRCVTTPPSSAPGPAGCVRAPCPVVQPAVLGGGAVLSSSAIGRFQGRARPRA